MRPQDAGYSTNPAGIDGAEGSRHKFRAFKAREEIAWRRQYWCASGAKGHAHAEQGRPAGASKTMTSTNYLISCPLVYAEDRSCARPASALRRVCLPPGICLFGLLS